MKVQLNIPSFEYSLCKYQKIKSFCPSVSLMLDDFLKSLGFASDFFKSADSSDFSTGDLVKVHGRAQSYFIRKFSIRQSVMCAFVVPVDVAKPLGFWVDVSRLTSV